MEILLVGCEKIWINWNIFLCFFLVIYIHYKCVYQNINFCPKYFRLRCQLSNLSRILAWTDWHGCRRNVLIIVTGHCLTTAAAACATLPEPELKIFQISLLENISYAGTIVQKAWVYKGRDGHWVFRSRLFLNLVSSNNSTVTESCLVI